MSDVVKPPIHGRDHRPGGSDPIPNIQGPGNLGFAASVQLPVLELAYQQNNLEASTTPTWAIDNTYAFNGYMEMNALNAYIAWPVILAPKGSTWMPYAVLAKGTDYGIVTIRFGSAPPVPSSDDSDGLGGAGLFYNYSQATFATLATFDCYTASPTSYAGPPQIFPGFRIMGEDGVLGTAFGTATVFATKSWDGGSGPHFLELSTVSKNASSTGYRMRISAVGMIRTDDQGLF